MQVVMFSSIVNLSSAMKLSFIALFVGLDHVIKRVAMESLTYAESIKINTFSDLYLIFNKGAALSFLNTQGGWQLDLFMSLVSLACIAAFACLVFLRSPGLCLSSALILLIGGAVGNLLDRWMHGFVVDYLRFNWQGYYSPTINLADCYLVAGILLLVVALFTLQRPSQSNVLVNGGRRGG